MTEAPKYLTLRNPEDKSRSAAFFGEDTATKMKPLLICEGPIDAALANQIGYPAIATRGLHVTKRDLVHLEHVCQRAGSVLIVFDAESRGAGTRGAAVLGEKLWHRGIRVRITKLPLVEGKKKLDLAEFIQAHGKDAANDLAVLLNQASAWLHWQIESISKELSGAELSNELGPLLLCVAELAGIERDYYRQLIRKRFDLTRRAVDEEMQTAVLRQQQQLARQKANAPMTADERKAAIALMESRSLLFGLKRAAQRLGVSKEGRNVLLLALAMISRLRDDPLSTVVKGQSSAGKSYLVERVARLMPPEGVHSWSGMSTKALIYSKADFKHKVLLIFERKGGDAAQESVRYLQSEKKLVYEVVVKNPQTGEFETVKYEKEGPIAFITTTTEATIEVDDENRSFSISPDESANQTARIMKANLRQKLAGTPMQPSEAELRVWHNAQRLLTEREIRIVLPKWFEDVRRMVPTKPLRIRRDWPRFLALCEVVTFLHQFQRPQKELLDGSIELTVTLEDYALARIIARDALRSSHYQLPHNTLKIIEAIRKKDDYITGVTYQDILKETGMTYAVVYKWAKPALQAGYLHYSYRTAKSNEKRIILGTPPKKDNLLPSPKRILKLYPKIRKCRYVDPLSGERVVLKASSKALKAKKPKKNTKEAD